MPRFDHFDGVLTASTCSAVDRDGGRTVGRRGMPLPARLAKIT